MRRVGVGMALALGAAAMTLPGSTSEASASHVPCLGGQLVSRWCAAVSRTRRDSVYPGPARPVVDALHYRLRLDWAPAQHKLRGAETLTFRATRDSSVVRLALARRIKLTHARLDGRRVQWRRHGSTLVLQRPIRRNSVHRVFLRYVRTPAKARPPLEQRNAVGMFRTERGDIFTNDAPVGAFSWYAVNDQPSDKAFYDFHLAVPAPRVGVANGRMMSRERRRRQVVTRFHLDRPAASYLITVEFGRYRRTGAGKLGRTPVTLWTPRGDRKRDRRALRAARYVPKALTWLEQRLGRYPFATVSVIVVDGYHSGMENQTLVTVGNAPYYRSREALLHELAHQWYGDLVTPRDWRDVWMNEGMATYLQQVYASQHDRESLEKRMRSFVSIARSYWNVSGPPARYHRRPFGDGNVYYPPMLMWHGLRKKVGYDPFWSMVRAWPHVHPYGSYGRVSYTHWIQTRFGRDLRGFFHAWLLGPTMPTYH